MSMRTGHARPRRRPPRQVFGFGFKILDNRRKKRSASMPRHGARSRYLPEAARRDAATPGGHPLGRALRDALVEPLLPDRNRLPSERAAHGALPLRGPRSGGDLPGVR